MLSKKQRVPANLIPILLKKGKRTGLPSFTFFMQEQKEKGESRFVFVVPVKWDKRAVKRNRLKRLMSEAVRTKWGEIKEGFDVLVMVRTKRKEINYAMVGRELGKAIQKAGLSKMSKKF